MHIHEKWINGVRWLDEVRSCECKEKTGEEYKLWCTVHQRGEKVYYCDDKVDYIERDGTKRWYLTEEAKRTVLNAVRRFKRGVAGVENGNSIKVEIEGDEKLFVSILRRSKRYFDAIIRCSNELQLLKKETVGGIIRETACLVSLKLKNDKLWDLLYFTTSETLCDNPFYKAALESGDELFPLQIKLFYNLADKEECKKLGIIIRKRVLPSLGEEYDRTFTVPQKEVDFGLLKRSGYTICHRPYFSMMGHTHALCELNPHRKNGVDAGRDDVEPTPFKEFLKLFKEANYR